jgi:CDP-6-deoxy-D-xylo-4-hexulose-3-dehydrase
VPGFNMRSTEINAVLGLEQLKRLDSNIEKRKNNLDVWLNNLDSDIFFTGFDLEGNSNFALPLVIKSKNKKVLNQVCEILENEKVEYRLGTAGGGNQSIQPHLEKYDFVVIGELTNIDHIHYHSLYVGNHTELEELEIINLCKKLNNVQK